MDFINCKLVVLVSSVFMSMAGIASLTPTTTRPTAQQTSQAGYSTSRNSSSSVRDTTIQNNLTTVSLQSITSRNRINQLRNQSVNDLSQVESGQLVRFQSGASQFEGRIEIYLDNQWISLCNDQWTQSNAHVICRQLGYKLGSAVAITKISEDSVTPVHGVHISHVTCGGNETRIQDCDFNNLNVCRTGQVASVRCALNTGCDPGWLAGDGLCYKLFTRAVSFESADDSCRSISAHLLRVESRQENDFVSNYLISGALSTSRVWTSGRRSATGPRDEWKWYHTSHLTRYNKWFPGWPPNSTQKQPMLSDNRDCISLSREFFNASWELRNAHYYFWQNWPCANLLPYVCKKAAELAENECYEGNGASYRGFAYTTLRGSVCQKWSLSTKLNQTSHPNAGLGDHNYCRNPDADRSPWCWVDTELSYFGYCTLLPCNPVCEWGKEIQCGIVQGGRTIPTCISISLVCNNRNDCSDGADERMCRRDQIQLTLAGGTRDANGRMTEGRVEVVINNITGTICDEGWNDQEATVICRMLGFGDGVAVRAGDYGQGEGAIWFDDVHCMGTETNILDCSYAAIGNNDCTHSEDARVRCSPLSSNTSVRPAAECGRRPIPQPRARIIGGQYAVYGAFPWQARIMKRSPETGEFLHSCGGTVIDKMWILSAAHCFEQQVKNNFRVRVGDHHNVNIDAYEQEFEVDDIISHPRYSSSTFLNGGTMYDSDMALVRIRATVTRPHIQFNNYVQPACLPTSLTSFNGSTNTQYRTGTLCEISGWGVTRLSVFLSDLLPIVLKSGIVPIMNTSTCQRSYVNALSENMFCAGYQHGRVDTCQGDSGGPLVCNIDGSYTVLGLTSWGHGCGHRSAPGVYTKVGQLVDWIRRTLAGRRRNV